MSRSRRNLKLALRMGSGVALITWALFATQFAHAANVMVAETELVIGSGASDFTLNAPSAGTFSVQLSDLDFGSRLASLSFSATTANTVLDALSGPTIDPISFTVGGAGTVYAHILGEAQGALDLGLYSVNIAFTPIGQPVPLPSTGWLLLAGLAALAGLGGALQLQSALPGRLAPQFGS